MDYPAGKNICINTAISYNRRLLKSKVALPVGVARGNHQKFMLWNYVHSSSRTVISFYLPFSLWSRGRLPCEVCSIVLLDRLIYDGDEWCMVAMCHRLMTTNDGWWWSWVTFLDLRRTFRSFLVLASKKKNILCFNFWIFKDCILTFSSEEL